MIKEERLQASIRVDADLLRVVDILSKPPKNRSEREMLITEEALSEVYFLKGLSAEKLSKASAKLSYKFIASGEPVYAFGESSPAKVFIVMKGTAVESIPKVSPTTNGSVVVIREIT